MGQMFSNICPISMFFTRGPLIILALAALPIAFGQAAKPAAVDNPAVSAQRGIKLAQNGRCDEALPVLIRASRRLTDKTVKRTAAFAGIRCAMLLNQQDAAIDFLRLLNRDFPSDPEVLALAVHTYSDLSTRAAQQLAMTAPNSVDAHKLNAEALEAQGKWDEAEKEYKSILQKNPQLPGIHFLLGRLLLSKPDPGPTVAEEAKKEFQQELELDPANAGAEYVLGELAREQNQWPEAIQHFSRATELDTGFGDAYLGLGIALLSAKRFPDAIPPLQTAVKLEPRNPASHYNLATALSRVGRKEEADKEFAIHRKMTQKDEAGQGQPEGQSQSPN
jgi:tetratricopeptide (TPR) repeat protein